MTQGSARGFGRIVESASIRLLRVDTWLCLVMPGWCVANAYRCCLWLDTAYWGQIVHGDAGYCRILHLTLAKSAASKTKCLYQHT